METITYNFETSPEYMQAFTDGEDRIISAVKRPSDNTNTGCLVGKSEAAISDTRLESLHCLTFNTASTVAVPTPVGFNLDVEVYNSDLYVYFDNITCISGVTSPYHALNDTRLAMNRLASEGVYKITNKYDITGFSVENVFLFDNYSGFDFLIGSKSKLEFLRYYNTYPIDLDDIRIPNLKCLNIGIVDNSNVYKFQNLLDRYKDGELQYLYIGNYSNEKIKNVGPLRFPDTIRRLYAIVYDTNLIPTACEVCAFGFEQCTGALETFVEKARAAGRTTGSLAILGASGATNVTIGDQSLKDASTGISEAGIVWDANTITVTTVEQPATLDCLTFRSWLNSYNNV